MQCPVCKKGSMSPTDLDDGLSGMTCETCSGVWLDRTKYDTWRAKQPQDLPETTMPAQTNMSDTHKAKICPRCSHLLLPYRVGHGLSCSIDYCSACGGVWFDQNEWATIKAKNLHDNLHDIVSQNWQTAVRKLEVQKSVTQTFARHLGDSYLKAQEIKTWLQGHPQKALLLAYLTDTHDNGQ